jgi:hypothetical protein
MNKRIRELAEQVYGSAATAQEIKFAELIVAECMNQVEEQYKPVLEDKEMMKDTHWDGYVQCGVDSYVAIREHFFGVEESKREKIDRAMREAFKDGVDLSGKETP